MNCHRLYIIIFSFVLCIACRGQNKTEPQQKRVIPDTITLSTFEGPHNISRNLLEDKDGNIWVAAFDGVFRYDGTSLVNMTHDITSDRFFSATADRNGNLWFGSIGAGIYRYDGSSFQNFTVDDGLVSNEVVSIYEDSDGRMWFGGNGGVSIYDGQAFHNYVIEGETMVTAKRSYFTPSFERPINEVNWIVEDKTGKLWLGTRGTTFIYDGMMFTALHNEAAHFTNVRHILRDSRDNIWLAGNDGLWRYDGEDFTNISTSFTGHIYEDKAGNIWTSSEESPRGPWALTRYEADTITNERPKATKIVSGEGMIFGILEAGDGSIWFGTLNGVKRYDGESIKSFKVE